MDENKKKLLTTENLPTVFREVKKYVDANSGCDCTGDGGGSSSGNSSDCYVVLDEINIPEIINSTQENPVSIEQGDFFSIINKCKEALNSCKRLVTDKVTDEAGTVSRYEITLVAVNLAAGVAHIKIDYGGNPYLIVIENNLTCYALPLGSNEGGGGTTSTPKPAPGCIVLDEIEVTSVLDATQENPAALDHETYQSIIEKCQTVATSEARFICTVDDGSRRKRYDLTGVVYDEDEESAQIELTVDGQARTVIFANDSCYTLIHSSGTASLEFATETEVKDVADETLSTNNNN